jgi:hypothetical protein
MKALSVRAPWWWFILHAGKDIENREWSTDFRGTIYLHASKWWSLEAATEDTAAARTCYERSGFKTGGKEFTFRELRDLGGHIVGQVDVVDCVAQSRSPWFFGRYGFVLANPIAYANPVPCKGMLGFFTPPEDIQAALRMQAVSGVRPDVGQADLFGGTR